MKTVAHTDLFEALITRLCTDICKESDLFRNIVSYIQSDSAYSALACICPDDLHDMLEGCIGTTLDVIEYKLPGKDNFKRLYLPLHSTIRL